MQNTFHHSQQETEIQQFANKETKKHTLKKKTPKTTEIVHCYKKKFNWDKKGFFSSHWPLKGPIALCYQLINRKIT